MNNTNTLMTIEEFFLASSQSVFDVLTEQQITGFFEGNGWRIGVYSVVELRECRNAFYNGVGVIGNETESGWLYLIVNHEGKLLYERELSSFRYLSYFHDGIILLEPYYDYYYDSPIASRIIDSKGIVLYEGNLGDLSRAFFSEGYIFLVGSKFTWDQRSRIENYRTESIYDRERVICPVCGGDLLPLTDEDDSKDGLLCMKCGHHYHEECWMLSDAQRQMADYYEDLLSSNNDYSNYGEESSDNDFYEDYSSEEDDFKEEDFLEEMYALFSVSKKKMIIPFQPCRIKYSRHYEAIFLEVVTREWSPVYRDDFSWVASRFAYSRQEAEQPEEATGTDIRYSNRISGKWYIGPRDENIFVGNIFSTFFDTFRSGPFIGQTLSLAFKHSYKRLWRMLYEGDIYIATIALLQLYQKYYKQYPTRVKALIYQRDCLFSFKPVSSIQDSLQLDNHGEIKYFDKDYGYENYDRPFFDDVSFEELLQYHPGYIIALIRHGKLTIADSVISQLNKDAPYYDSIMEEIEEREKEEEERQREEYERYCEQLEASYNYEEDTYYALGGDDYQRFKENGGSIDEMMDSMGL